MPGTFPENPNQAHFTRKDGVAVTDPSRRGSVGGAIVAVYRRSMIGRRDSPAAMEPSEAA
jgi:hypothetical protein